MTINLPEKPSVEDVTLAVMSFNDPNLITMLFNQLGWNLSFEIKETLAIAKQNENLNAKMSAIKYLRTLLKEAAEASGYLAKVTQTRLGQDGSMTSFSAKRMASALNPTKKVESIQENNNDKKEQEPEEVSNDRGSNRESSDRPRSEESLGRSTESDNGGATTSDSNCSTYGDSIESPSGGRKYDNESSAGETCSGGGESGNDEGNSPCVKNRPPTRARDLYPGISGNTEGKS